MSDTEIVRYYEWTPYNSWAVPNLPFVVSGRGFMDRLADDLTRMLFGPPSKGGKREIQRYLPDGRRVTLKGEKAKAYIEWRCDLFLFQKEERRLWGMMAAGAQKRCAMCGYRSHGEDGLPKKYFERHSPDCECVVGFLVPKGYRNEDKFEERGIERENLC